MENSPGKLITYEGIDGTGKTTQARLLVERLQAAGHTVVASREPTQGRYGQELRRLVASGERPDVNLERALFEADRWGHVHDVILPALHRGAVVVLDRYYHSSVAYQGSRPRGETSAVILTRNERFAPRPDLVILLDLDPVLALGRLGRPPDAFEQLDTLTRAADVYRGLLDPRIYRIDASQPPDVVAADAWQVVEALLAR